MTETTPQKRRLGYARVSTYGQTLDAQLEQLRADGCAKIFRGKVTGKRADRRELLKLLKAITPGDVVTVTRIESAVRAPRNRSPSGPSAIRRDTSQAAELDQGLNSG